jgi:flagellar protein FlgJ
MTVEATGSRNGHLTVPLYGAGAADLELRYPAALEGHTEGGTNRLIPKDKAVDRQQLVRAGQQFEAYFISYLLKVMRETVPQGAIANKEGAYFHSFYDQEIGIRAAESGGIGITRMVQEYAEKYFSAPPVQPSSSAR